MTRPTLTRLRAVLDRTPVLQVLLLIAVIVAVMLFGEYTGVFGV